MGRCQRFVSEHDLRCQDAVGTEDETAPLLRFLAARPQTSVGISDAHLSRSRGVESPCVHAYPCRPCFGVADTLMATVAPAVVALTLRLVRVQSVGVHQEALAKREHLYTQKTSATYHH